MANCCFLGIDCTFDSEEWASKYAEIMTGMSNYSRSVEHMTYMGSSRRYLGDSEVSLYKDYVRLDGWTKWSLDHEEALDVIAFAKFITNNHLITMTIDYSETSANVYGRYTYTRGVEDRNGKIDERSGKVVDRYIPENEWPDIEWDDDDNEIIKKGDKTWDDEEEALAEILSENGTEEVFHECL